MTEVKQLVNFLSIRRLNLLTSLLFFASILIKSRLLWLVFFISWELLLIRLFISQRKENKYLFSYTFLAAFIAVLCLNIWVVISWI
ncbi:hypothetical protein [Lutispora saccharofermentans]|uniref:Uncharacterized protein n=1 Tax=Lutispora saccharofermentans TaxID=3024236 RepID=A0ABT1NKL0_9FIRM|nr:hypothetical protein [Lutispora saccharofermentans]MCQ1531803.1 hypothetical protein [Lutispora saccharofermentans]